MVLGVGLGQLHGFVAATETLELTISHCVRRHPCGILLHVLAQGGQFVLGQSHPGQPGATGFGVRGRFCEGHDGIRGAYAGNCGMGVCAWSARRTLTGRLGELVLLRSWWPRLLGSLLS